MTKEQRLEQIRECIVKHGFVPTDGIRKKLTGLESEEVTFVWFDDFNEETGEAFILCRVGNRSCGNRKAEKLLAMAEELYRAAALAKELEEMDLTYTA